MKGETLSVVGLGKLGVPMAVCLAAKGFRVIGVDTDATRVDALNGGRSPIFEPGVPDLLPTLRDRLTATTDLEAAVASSDVTFIVVPTPSDSNGGFSLRYVLPACKTIGRALQKKASFHLVVLTSTVMPGSTAGPVQTTLEETSGKSCGVEFGLCYGPEFIALGSVVRDFLNPDFVLIGESDPGSGARLEGLYQQVCENHPPIARMSIINAELTKLSVNTYVTTKISFANMLSRICEKLPGADVDVVTRALGMDSRIGAKYLRGAISYGGPCFPRDNLALAALARQVGAPADIAQVTDRFNRAQIHWLADLALAGADGNRTMGILGLTYKQGTDVVEASPGLLLGKEFLRRGAPVIAYDPAGNGNARRGLGARALFASSAEECIRSSGVVTLTTPWPEFASIHPEVWAGPDHHRRVVIDCWNQLGHLPGSQGVHYIRLGAGEFKNSRSLSAASSAKA